MFYLKRVDEYQYKLDHLHGCEISFPAEIFLYAGPPPGREEVVEVHHTVHPGVQEGSEPALASSDKPGPPPGEPGQGAVVDHVEGRHLENCIQMGLLDTRHHTNLIELLPHYKEYCVKKINKF